MKTLKIFVFAILFISSTQVSAAIISLLPSQTDVVAGGSLTLDIVVSGLGSDRAPSIGAYDININFDSALFDLASVNWGNGLDALGLGTFRLDMLLAPGLLNLFELSFDSTEMLNMFQLPTFTLGSLKFDVLGPGTGIFSSVANSISDASGEAIVADQAFATVQSRDSATSVNEPGGLLIMLMGLAALIRQQRQD